MVELTFTKNASPQYVLCPYTQCDETPSVQLLNEAQKLDFENEIDGLNVIIRDDKLLHEATGEYYMKCVSSEMGLLEPYASRVSKKLFSLGLLPCFVRGNKLTAILNHIDCESHRDKMIFALKRKLK